MKETTKKRKIRRAVNKLLVEAITLVVAVIITFCVFKVNTKVFMTQVQLGYIASEIRFYNDNLGYTSKNYDEYAHNLIEYRRDLMHSDDPLVAFAAKYGFSFFIFLPTILIYPVFCFLWYYGLKNKKLVIGYSEIFLQNSLESVIDFLIWFLAILIKTCLLMSDLFLDGALTFSFGKMKLRNLLKKIRHRRHCRQRRYRRHRQHHRRRA